MDEEQINTILNIRCEQLCIPLITVGADGVKVGRLEGLDWREISASDDGDGVDVIWVSEGNNRKTKEMESC